MKYQKYQLYHLFITKFLSSLSQICINIDIFYASLLLCLLNDIEIYLLAQLDQFKHIRYTPKRCIEAISSRIYINNPTTKHNHLLFQIKQIIYKLSNSKQTSSSSILIQSQQQLIELENVQLIEYKFINEICQLIKSILKLKIETKEKKSIYYY